MAKPLTLIQLLDKLSPSVRKAFEQAIARVKNDIQYPQLEAALKSGNIEAAVAAIGVELEYFRQLEEQLRATHIASGDLLYQEARYQGKRQGIKVLGQFSTRNLRAERILREWSSDQVVSIVESTREAIREALANAIERGTSPRAAGRLIAGRVNAAGVRTGGLVGLDPAKSRYVNGGWVNGKYQRGMRDNLEELDSHYFTRKLRDRRFDPMVRRAIAEGKPLTNAQITKLTDSYSSRLLKLRGETIARTELLGSMHAAQDEGLDQLIDSGQVESSESVTGTWKSSSDKDTREDHRKANGQERKHGDPFDIGGWPMLRPGDSSLGAPVEQIANCRCYKKNNINFVKGLKSRLSSGELELARSLMT